MPPTPSFQAIAFSPEYMMLDLLFKAAGAREWVRFRELLAAAAAADAGFLRVAAVTKAAKSVTLLHTVAIMRGGVEDMKPLLEAGGSMMALALNDEGQL